MSNAQGCRNGRGQFARCGSRAPRKLGGRGAVFQTAEGAEILSSDGEHPISSKLSRDGSLEQMGISCEGFQREVAIHRRTEHAAGGKYKFCWELVFYQHPGMRRTVPLGCSAAGSKEAPADAKRMARAFHALALAGYDPRNPPPVGRGGIPRGHLWHRFVLPAICGNPTKATVIRELKREGYWPKG